MYSARQIISQFLFGTTEKPTDLLSPSLIRSETMTTLEIDAQEYMESGPGRFAKISMVPIVQTFFSTSLLQPTGVRQEFSLADLTALIGPGTNIFGESSADRFRLQQSNYDDGLDNAIERTFIWNSTSFVLAADTNRDGQSANDIKFVVNADGSRHIENAQLLPFDQGNRIWLMTPPTH